MTTSTNNSVNTTAKINVTEGNVAIESAKVTVDEAVAILNRLNYMGATFQYRFTTREYNADIEYRNFDAYKADGTGVRFSLTEIVINGKLEVVRFYNHYRNIVVDLQVGNVAYIYGYKGEIEIVETDASEPTTNNAPETDASEDDDAPEYVEPELGTTGGFPDLYEVTEFTDNGYSKRYTAFDNLRDAFNFANASIFPADITLIQGEQCYFICDDSGEFVTHREKFARAVHCLIEERDNVSPFDLLPELDELNDVDDVPDTPIVDEHKPTVEIKTAKNGTKIFYADRKRVSRDTALKIAEQNRGENLFYLEWEHEVTSYYVGGGIENSFHPARKELRTLDIRIDEYHGYTVICNGSRLHEYRYKENAVWLVNAIIKAYVGGERGIKIERSGQVVIVDAGQSATA